MKHKLSLLWYCLTLSLKTALMYRFELSMWAILEAIPLLAVLVLWQAAFDTNTIVATYTQAALVAYYVVGYCTNALTGAYFEDDVIEEVISGHFSFWLLKPVSYKLVMTVMEIGWRGFTLLLSVLPVLLLSLFVVPEFVQEVDWSSWYLIPLFMAGAFILDSCLSLLIGAASFVFEDANSLSHLKWMLVWLFSGSMIPFELFPAPIKFLAQFLPFQFRFYIPVQIALGRISTGEVLFSLLQMGIWLLVLLGFVTIAWKKSLRRYTAVGA